MTDGWEVGMSDPISVRFVPIREAVCTALVTAPALQGVKAVVRDREAFARLPATQHPALGVFFADPVGGEQARWASNSRDHSYQFEVHAVVRSLESGQACEELLFGYVEAIENALRVMPTLGGLVRCAATRLVRRTRTKAGAYWHAQAAVLVVCGQRVQGGRRERLSADYADAQ